MTFDRNLGGGEPSQMLRGETVIMKKGGAKKAPGKSDKKENNNCEIS